MTALQIARKKYSKFTDKYEITRLINNLHRVEAENKKRDEEGIATEDFESSVFDEVSKRLRTFVDSKRSSFKVKELCIEIMKEMNYQS